MNQYLAFFKIKFIAGLQYRAAALAGMSTQFFFGAVFIMVYFAFYLSGSSNAPMTLKDLVTYIWLGQIFYSLTYVFHKETDVIEMIKNGNVAYELCRPGRLYFKWLARIYASKLANVTLRFLPVLIISCLLPQPFNLSLPYNIYSFIGFIITLILASILITTIVTLLHILIFYTIDSDGILSGFKVAVELFSGGLVPILFLPKILQKISSFLPFQYISDIPFRIYIGSVANNQILSVIIIQIIWIVIIIIISNLLTNNALKHVVVQGG